MEVIKKITIVIFTIACILAVMPQKVDAIDFSGVMTGGDKFIEGAEERQLFDKDKEKERHRSNLFHNVNHRNNSYNCCRISSRHSAYCNWICRTSKSKRKTYPICIWYTCSIRGIWYMEASI